MVSHVKLVVSCGCYRDPSIVPSPSNRCIALVERFCPHVARGRFLFARLDIGLATRMLAVAGIDHRILCICQEADEAMDVRTSAQRKALQYCILFGTQHPNSQKTVLPQHQGCQGAAQNYTSWSWLSALLDTHEVVKLDAKPTLGRTRST